MRDSSDPNRTREFPSRWRSIRTRIALIAIGLLLGYLAKTFFPPANGSHGQPLFVPMPSAQAENGNANIRN